MRRASLFCCSLAAAALLLGACGTDPVDDLADTAPTPAAEAECVDRTDQPGQADLELADVEFRPECLIMTQAQGLSLQNTGDIVHNFSVEGFEGLDVDVQPGETNNTEPTGLEPGTYTFFCKYHRGAGMEGELRLQSG